jgi:predicted nuclease of predicted toxin-antitoxin system
MSYTHFYLFVDNNIQASHSQQSHERSQHFDGLIITGFTAITIGVFMIYYKDQHIVHFSVIIGIPFSAFWLRSSVINGCSYVSI